MARIEYDGRTLRAVFGKSIRPVISIATNEINTEAQKLAGQLSISGVQPKLSMRLEGNRLVTVAAGGQFILKPQTQNFVELPQNEYLCMTMADRFGLRVAPCLLLELADGAPAYLVRRFDRIKRGRRLEKLPCEDMQQVLGGDKYAGSHEMIVKAIRDHCTFADLDIQRLYELTIFNFAIGNGDCHRKNISLLTDLDGTVRLSPAYDLASSRLVLPSEKYELAMTLNARRNHLKRNDFLQFADHCRINRSFAEGRLERLLSLRDTFNAMIAESQLSPEMRNGLASLVADRLDRLKA